MKLTSNQCNQHIGMLSQPLLQITEIYLTLHFTSENQHNRTPSANTFTQ